MKINNLLLNCVIFLFLFSFSNNFSVKSTSQKTKPDSKSNEPFFQGYFYLQILYPGLDALENIKFYSTKSELKYFTLKNNQLYYSDSLEEVSKIRAGININKILDRKSDIPSQGKCCENIKYVNYVKSSETDPTKTAVFKKNADGSKPSKKAYFCIEIFAPFEARWRLCSNKVLEVYRFHLKLVFYMIKFNVNMKKVDSNKIMDKFLSNTKLSSQSSATLWNWETQKKWEGKCKSKLMQSPIEIKQSNTMIPKGSGLKFYYQIMNSNVEVVRRFNEIIVKFQNDPGLFMIEVKNKRLVYEPKYISFRFPGQNLINNNRYVGEMLINCKELSIRSKKNTNGLIISIPLEADPKYSNFEPLESLSMDFWKFMVNKNGKYLPRNYITKQRLIFQMKNIINHITELKTHYYLYLGSQDTPPCEEFTYHLVVQKPIKIANCQLKVLRENSLAITEVKVVHSRLLQVNNPDEYDIEEKSSETIDYIDKNIDLGENGREEKVLILTKIFPHNDLYKYVPKDSITKKKKHQMIKKKKKKILAHPSNVIRELSKTVNC